MSNTYKDNRYTRERLVKALETGIFYNHRNNLKV